MPSQHPGPSTEGRRIVICDYNGLLLSASGLLRMSGYCVFQAPDGWAARELCALLPDIDLLVLNTHGSGVDVGHLCRSIRRSKRGLPILHIGSTTRHALPADVPTLPETFTSDSLLWTVQALIEPALRRADPLSQPTRKPLSYPNGRRWEDSGSRSGVARPELRSARSDAAAPVGLERSVTSCWMGRLLRWMAMSGAAARN
jgi:CheY-like chemotaxis protein